MQRFLANCSYRMLRSSLSNVANNISCSVVFLPTFIKTGLTCVASVSSRGSSRKLGQEQKKKESIGNACYAG